MASTLALVVGVGAVTLGGCRRSSEDTSRTETTSAQDRVGENAAEAPHTALSAKDQEFVRKATQGSLFEIAMGRYVAERGNSPDVKVFAGRMVTDHGKANDELSQLAAKKNFVPPATLDGEHREDVDELAKHEGPKLDKAYMADMVEDHEHDVKEFRKASKEATDPELRAWAAKTLPTLESHLTLAKETKAKVDAKH